DVLRRALPAEADFRRHRAFRAYSAYRDPHRLERMTHGIHHRTRLVSAVHHAIGAFFVIAGAVIIPIRLPHHLIERLRIPFAEKVARALPAEHRPGRITPGRTAVLLIAGKEIEKEARLVEAPAPTAIAMPEDRAEQLLCGG